MTMNRRKLTGRQQRVLERQLAQAEGLRLYRRTLAVLEYGRGRPVDEIAELLRVSRRSVYNWIEAYCQRLDPSRLADAARPGRPRLWAEDEQALLRSLLETSPERLGYSSVNWTVPLFQEQIERATGARFSEDTIRRALHAEDYVWKRPRYLLEPDPEREKKASDPPNPAWIGPRNRPLGPG
jgi:transposase